MPLLPSALAVVGDKLSARVNLPHLTAIKAWSHSDCTVPERIPPKWLAVQWWANDFRCTVHDNCLLCHSCAACRPEQRAPVGDWDGWYYLGGRGTGKTRSVGEYWAAKAALNTRWRIGILAPTYADARDTCVEGESGLQAVMTNWGWEDGREYTWNRSLGELILRDSRSRFKLFSAEKPARLRGPQHHGLWVEEWAQVELRSPAAIDMALFGLRLGTRPRLAASTTPLPLKGIRDALSNKDSVVTRGTTDSNAANLPASTVRSLHSRYDGTALGRQELGGELLDDVPGALWKRAWLDLHRIPADTVDGSHDTHAVRVARRIAVRAALAALSIELVRIVIAVDPAVKSKKDADDTGVIVAGVDAQGSIYILEDATLHNTPGECMDRVIECHDAWRANLVVLEVNNGGDYIPGMLQARLLLLGRNEFSIAVDTVHAKQGKRVRAEPVAALYQPHPTSGAPGTVRHVGTHDHLEDLLCTWQATSPDSPDRMDAAVYAVLYLDTTGHGSAMAGATATLPRGLSLAGSSARIPTASVGGGRR